MNVKTHIKNNKKLNYDMIDTYKHHSLYHNTGYANHSSDTRNMSLVSHLTPSHQNSLTQKAAPPGFQLLYYKSPPFELLGWLNFHLDVSISIEHFISLFWPFPI